jgi:hypothetical protein
MAAFPLTCRQRELSWFARYNSGADCRAIKNHWSSHAWL